MPNQKGETSRRPIRNCSVVRVLFTKLLNTLQSHPFAHRFSSISDLLRELPIEGNLEGNRGEAEAWYVKVDGDQ